MILKYFDLKFIQQRLLNQAQFSYCLFLIKLAIYENQWDIGLFRLLLNLRYIRLHKQAPDGPLTSYYTQWLLISCICIRKNDQNKNQYGHEKDTIIFCIRCLLCTWVRL